MQLYLYKSNIRYTYINQSIYIYYKYIYFSFDDGFANHPIRHVCLPCVCLCLSIDLCLSVCLSLFCLFVCLFCFVLFCFVLFCFVYLLQKDMLALLTCFFCFLANSSSARCWSLFSSSSFSFSYCCRCCLMVWGRGSARTSLVSM